MKRLILPLAVGLLCFAACKKESADEPTEPTNLPSVNASQGLGSAPGYPVGTVFNLPSNIKIVGEIRGGIQGKGLQIDKETYKGPFPMNPVKNWLSYGSGTYVNLYFLVYNNHNAPVTLTFPGGLIFCDTPDDNQEPEYQRGLLLQTVNISIGKLDTAWIHLPLYCLNMNLSPSDSDAVYYIGPVTIHSQLRELVLLLQPKQYPFGEEANIQAIVWNITDNGESLTPSEIQYLNSLP